MYPGTHHIERAYICPTKVAQHSSDVGFLDYPGLVQHLWAKAPQSCGNHGRRPSRHILHRDHHYAGRDGA